MNPPERSICFGLPGPVYSYTAGIYHQWTKSLKLVFEGTEEGSTGPGRPKQIDLSGGFMLFY